MSKRIRKDDVRYIKMELTPVGINYIHRSNPWTAVWWSAALPGFGHMHLGAYIRGLGFMLGEIIINLKGHLNLAIFYTFIGNFEKANYILKENWTMFYVTIWVFALFDTWRLSIELNKICDLEKVQTKRYFKRMSLTPISITKIDKSNPFYAAFFSTVMGGAGQIYNGQFIKGVILLGWVMTVNYHAQVNYMISRFFNGKQLVLNDVNWQWLLFFPSVFAFCIWDSYVSSVEINNLLVEEQRYHFTKNKTIKGSSEGSKYPMYLIGASKQNLDLELIVTSLKTHGIDKYKIVFLDSLNNINKETGDSIRKSDGISNFNGAMCGATVLMLFGTMWGGHLIPGGPIAIGLAGFVIGGIAGYVIDRYLIGLILAKLNKDPIKGSNPIDGEVLIIAKTINREQYDYVNKTFSENHVAFAGELDHDNLL